MVVNQGEIAVQPEADLGDAPHGNPVLVPEVSSKWPAATRWSPAYLAETFGTRRVVVEARRSGASPLDYDEIEVDVATYCHFLETGECTVDGYVQLYLSDVRVERALPELRSDIETPRFLGRAPRVRRFIFFGRDSTTAFHYHSRDQALLCQVVGAKDVVLCAPQHFHELRFEPFLASMANHSPVQPGDALFQELRSRRPESVIDVRLEPGDALFIPLHWPHWVEGRGISMSIAFFWRARSRDWFAGLPGAARVRLHALGVHTLGRFITKN